jgi:MraZ protein
MLRGNLPAKLDPKGRLKIPSTFRKIIEENFGNRLFVTSLNGDCVRIYPFPVWEEIEEKLAAPPTMKPEKIKFMDMTNYWGQEAEMDDQGRVLIHLHLREAAGMEGDVAVMGRIKYLEVWQDAAFRAQKIEGRSFDEHDLEALASLGI